MTSRSSSSRRGARIPTTPRSPQHRRRYHRRAVTPKADACRRCRITAMFGVSRRSCARASRRGCEGAVTTGAGRHRGPRARRLEHVRLRRAGLASRWRHRPALSNDLAEIRLAVEPARSTRGRPPLGGRHRRTPRSMARMRAEPSDSLVFDGDLPCTWPSQCLRHLFMRSWNVIEAALRARSAQRAG